MIGYTQKIKVDVHDVDFNGVCRASSLMKYFQSAAQMQLTENGMTYEALKARGRAFILSRIKLEFTSAVYAHEALEALTFPCHSRGYSFLRCYQLSRDGVIVGRAASVWALIDVENHGLVKVNDFDLGLTTYEPLNDITLSHIRMPSQLSEVGIYTVTYADLDQNKHVNNTRYADIYSNFLGLDGKRISSMSISYMNEARHNERLRVLMAESNGTYYVRTVKEDGRVNSEAEITLTEI